MPGTLAFERLVSGDSFECDPSKISFIGAQGRGRIALGGLRTTEMRMLEDGMALQGLGG
jgi:hypothetical protein